MVTLIQPAIGVDFSILWWIGVMETSIRTDFIALPLYFSILWWIGVMETYNVAKASYEKLKFQYPLVDWGDGDKESGVPNIAVISFQYPLVDWGDGDLNNEQQAIDFAYISVSSGGLG